MKENNKTVFNYETWIDVRGWEGLYEVSSIGRVRSLDRRINDKNGRTVHYKGRLIKQSKNKGGYLYVNLHKPTLIRNYRVHTLVAKEFLGYQIGGKLVVDHIDGNKLNNIKGNLDIITHRANTSKGNLCIGNTSNYVGVAKQNGRNRYRTVIKFMNITVDLGSFIDEHKAGKVYQIALNKFLKNEDYYKEEISHLSTKEKREYLLN